ncbi:MAG: helix-turn-helix domain-containing protein [Agathobacter sp.]|nr:helix-turn-helix transcriptional regulator [Agathobacter sp.]MCR5678258.1 helix-turn-helix domain-containing protein [Agathobacter sp.]
MAFSENLIKQRKIKGLTQDDIAEAMEVSRQSVSKWRINAGLWKNCQIG